MAINEIEAFQQAMLAAQQRGWRWQAPFWIGLSNGEWEVQAECEQVIRISEASGEVVAESIGLNPAAALSVAKEFAAANGLSWRPSYSLERVRDGWIVGACQSQFGGQVAITVSHQGQVIGNSVNRK